MLTRIVLLLTIGALFAIAVGGCLPGVVPPW